VFIYIGVYARVSSAMDWIKSAGCGMSKAPSVLCGTMSSPVASPVAAPVASPVAAPTSCSTVTVKFAADKWSEESSFTLENLETGDLVWDEKNFKALEVRTKTSCIKSSGCHLFDISDTEEDGLLSPGQLTLTYAGKQIYKGRKYGAGIVAYLGDGCDEFEDE
jgi:hypothetical protein